MLHRLVPADGELADTLAGVLGVGAVATWLKRPIAALDGRQTADVLASGPDGYELVRHVLMRMPV